MCPRDRSPRTRHRPFSASISRVDSMPRSAFRQLAQDLLDGGLAPRAAHGSVQPRESTRPSWSCCPCPSCTLLHASTPAAYIVATAQRCTPVARTRHAHPAAKPTADRTIRRQSPAACSRKLQRLTQLCRQRAAPASPRKRLQPRIGCRCDHHHRSAVELSDLVSGSMSAAYTARNSQRSVRVHGAGLRRWSKSCGVDIRRAVSSAYADSNVRTITIKAEAVGAGGSSSPSK